MPRQSKPKWEVILSSSTHVIVSADSYDEAMDKAEAKINKRNKKWMAETASELEPDELDQK